jgi:hypothetical protein
MKNISEPLNIAKAGGRQVVYEKACHRAQSGARTRRGTRGQIGRS